MKEIDFYSVLSWFLESFLIYVALNYVFNEPTFLNIIVSVITYKAILTGIHNAITKK